MQKSASEANIHLRKCGNQLSANKAQLGWDHYPTTLQGGKRTLLQCSFWSGSNRQTILRKMVRNSYLEWYNHRLHKGRWLSIGQWLCHQPSFPWDAMQWKQFWQTLLFDCMEEFSYLLLSKFNHYVLREACRIPRWNVKTRASTPWHVGPLTSEHPQRNS